MKDEKAISVITQHILELYTWKKKILKKQASPQMTL